MEKEVIRYSCTSGTILKRLRTIHKVFRLRNCNNCIMSLMIAEVEIINYFRYDEDSNVCHRLLEFPNSNFIFTVNNSELRCLKLTVNHTLTPDM